MERVFGPAKGNRRAPVAAPGRPRPTAQRGGGGNKAAGSPEPTAASSTVATVSPSGVVSGASAAATRAAAASKRRATKIKRQVGAQERRVAAAALAEVSATRAKRSRERANPKTPKPSSYLGRKTAGAPTRAELDQAHTTGTLKVNNAGAVTTPSVRQASKHLRKAAAALAAAQPHIEGLRNQAQTAFAEELSKKTGIPPKLAGEWVLQESGASAAGAGGEAGEQNELGVGYPAHPTSFSQSPYFNNTTPKRAADATAKWMEGKLGAEYDYQAADSIQQIPRLAKSGASEEEIRAYIAGPSAWGTGTIAQSGVSATPGKGARKAAKQVRAATKEAKSLGLKPKAASGGTGVKVPYKAFGKTVRVALKAVTRSKAYRDDSSPTSITIHGPGRSTLVREVQGSSGVASVIDKNKDPEIAARLLLLSAKTGKTIYVLSGYRTPAQAVSVGGFADDPHTKGEAMDIGVDGKTISSANGISEAEYESVGLYRPYGTAHGGSSAEDNHVQLLHGGTPSTGGYIEGSEAAPSTGGSTGSVPAAATIAVAQRVAAGAKSKKAKAKQRAKKKLTTEQRYLQNKRKLRSVGAPVTSSSSRSGRSESHPILEELKAKYGSAPTATKESPTAA